MASFAFSEMKKKGINVALIGEFVKRWAYLGRVPTGFDQVYLFGKQLHYEHELLNAKVPFIVSDCPILHICSFARKNRLPFYQELVNITMQYEEAYPGLHIFLNRVVPYQDEGRYETIEEAVKLDELMLGVLNENMPNFVRFRGDDQTGVVKFVLDKI